MSGFEIVQSAERVSRNTLKLVYPGYILYNGSTFPDAFLKRSAQKHKKYFGRFLYRKDCSELHRNTSDVLCTFDLGKDSLKIHQKNFGP